MKIYIFLIILITCRAVNIFSADSSQRKMPTLREQIEQVRKDGDERYLSGRPYDVQLKLIQQLAAEAALEDEVKKQENSIGTMLAAAQARLAKILGKK